MVRPARFELATPWFEAKYSNPLSYGRIHKYFGANDGARTRDIRDHNPTLYQTELHPP
jgi:hypothetical protein